MSEKLLCLTCHSAYEPKPNADAHDRNFCENCLSKEYLYLKKLPQNTTGFDRPAGKRRKPKTKKKRSSLVKKIRKTHVYKTIFDLAW